MGLFAVQDLGNTAEDPRRRNIPPALGLVFAAAWLGIEVGLQAVFVMMELRLARLLRSLGLRFKQVAEPVEYHGLRAPFEITSETLLDRGEKAELPPALLLQGTADRFEVGLRSRRPPGDADGGEAANPIGMLGCQLVRAREVGHVLSIPPVTGRRPTPPRRR